MDQHAGDPGQPPGVADHGTVVEESAMGVVVRAEADERQHVVVHGLAVCHRLRVRLQRQHHALPAVPARCGPRPHRGIGVLHQPGVRGHDAVIGPRRPRSVAEPRELQRDALDPRGPLRPRRHPRLRDRPLLTGS